MLNILKYELKNLVSSLLIWSVSIFGLMALFMVMFPSFGSDAEKMEKIMENYPEALLKAFGMSNELPLSSVLGYFVLAFAFIHLCLAIQAANYGFSVLSVEEREFTADFLMSKPVSRAKILLSKFIASFIALTVVNAVTWISSFVCIELFRNGKDYDSEKLILLLSSIVIFQLYFLCVGMAVSVILRKIRNVLSFSLGIAFGMYILNALRAIIDGKILGVITPFYHFDPAYILANGKYNIGMTTISIGIIIISMITTYILYLKRDIHSL